MILTTTSRIEGMRILQYHDIVIGEAPIVGANVFRDYFASIRDIVGGRSAAYEKGNEPGPPAGVQGPDGRRAASLGANAVVGVDIDYEVIHQAGVDVARLDHRNSRQRRRRLTGADTALHA